MHRLVMTGILVGLMSITSACVVATHDRDGRHDGYREGYYDRDHHRWYHENSWRDCGPHDDHCR